MLKVVATVEFILHGSCENMSETELVEHIQSQLEDERSGVAEYASCGVTKIIIEPVSD